MSEQEEEQEERQRFMIQVEHDLDLINRNLLQLGQIGNYLIYFGAIIICLLGAITLKLFHG